MASVAVFQDRSFLVKSRIENGDKHSGFCIEADQPVRFYGEVTCNGKDYLIAENLYLPLADEKGQPRFIMGFCRYNPASADKGDLRERIENAMLSAPGGLL